SFALIVLCIIYTSYVLNLLVLCSVTLVKSNAKALLTGKPIKNATCKQVLRSPRGKEPPLKRHSLHTPLNFICVGLCR
uniref:hypothetical protein n=1 Tax=Ruminococcus bromii TaxID=40518 RepID=UPI003FEEB6AA